MSLEPRHRLLLVADYNLYQLFLLPFRKKDELLWSQASPRNHWGYPVYNVYQLLGVKDVSLMVRQIQ